MQTKCIVLSRHCFCTTLNWGQEKWMSPEIQLLKNHTTVGRELFGKMKSILLALTLNWKCVLFTNFSWLSSTSTSYPAQPGRGTETWLRRVSPTAAFPSVSSGKKIRLLLSQQKQSFFKDNENEWLQWRPIQMRAFYSNENGLFCTHPLSVAPLFWWKERGKQEALIWMKNSHINRTLQ